MLIKTMFRRSTSNYLHALATLFLSGFASAECRAADNPDVKVEKSAPTVSRREFNPWNPFEAKPKLGPGQKALTEFSFALVVGIDDIDVLDQEERHGRWFVHIRPKNLRARLSLPIVIWLPQGAPQKCIAHEEGHRVIAERIYEFAGDIVKHYAAQVQSSTYPGEGATPELAIKDAHKRAVSELNQNYRGTVFDYCLLVTQEYDRLTNHGLLPIKEDEAIKLSFDKCGAEMIRLLEERHQAQQPKPQSQGPVTKLDSTEKEAPAAGQKSESN